MRRPDPRGSERRCRTGRGARSSSKPVACVAGSALSLSSRTRARARRLRLSACATERRCVRFARHVCARRRARRASRVRALLPEAGSSRRRSRCVRSPRRSPSSSSTSRPSRAHHDPILEWGPARPARARAARDRHRWPVAAGCPPPRRRLGCVHRATGESRSGRFEIGPPSGCRRRHRRRRPRWLPLRSGTGVCSTT